MTASPIIIDYSSVPPTFFPNWITLPAGRQLPNLHRGQLDINTVKAMQGPSQKYDPPELGVIERELKDYILVGGSAAESFRRPENLDVFVNICPKGCLVFLEKYGTENSGLKVVVLYVRDGLVHAASLCASDGVFPWVGGEFYFAVIDPAAQPTP